MQFQRKVSFYTLGCKLNFSESSTLARSFEEAGYARVAFDEEPDVFVINTCSVTENADKKCKQLVRKAKEINPNGYVAIVGCFAQLKPEAIAKIPGVNMVLGANEKFKLLEEVEGKPEQNLVQSQAIRTMSKAYYTTHKTIHYGLAFDHYTHFTSPIRRYPDLIAHRLLFEYLNKGKSASEIEIVELCKKSSAMEVKASEAERASVRYKQVEYISDFIGEEFDGIISGVTDWGVYVEISQFKAEGLIRIQNLGDDYFEYDEANKCIIGRSTRKKLTLGDPLRVLVVAADIFKRQIDLAWVDGNLRKSFKATFEKPGRKKDKKAKSTSRKRKR
jgi:VacB/RNase II family 3'-5' exoribonuclease